MLSTKPKPILLAQSTHTCQINGKNGKVTIHGFGTPALPDFETPALPDSETSGLPGSLRGSEAPGGYLMNMNMNFANNVELSEDEIELGHERE